MTGISCGLAGSSLCINRRLAAIASCRTVSISQREKRNLVLIDVAIAVGIPALVMILSYIPQPHRFDILEGYGCQNVVWKSLPAVFLVYLWPVVISMISLIYGGRTSPIPPCVNQLIRDSHQASPSDSSSLAVSSCNLS
jgi:pheromone a factor receptor